MAEKSEDQHNLSQLTTEVKPPNLEDSQSASTTDDTEWTTEEEKKVVRKVDSLVLVGSQQSGPGS
jgi:hypothetical protein